MNNKPTTAEIIVLAAGAAALVFSFLDWIEYGGEVGANAWDEGLFPIFTYVGIFGGLMAVLIALEVFAGTRLPDRILGFSVPQVHFALADFCALLVLGYLIADTGGSDKAMGFWLSLLAAGGLVVGAYMLMQERPAGVRVAPVAGPGPGFPPAAPPPSAPPPPPPV